MAARDNVTDLQDRIDRMRTDPAGPDWRKPLQRRGKSYIGDERNVLLAFQLAPELAGVIRFNEFALNIEFTRAPPWRVCVAGSPWIEKDDAGALAWFQQKDIAVRSGAVVANAALLAASDHPFHPVRDYQDSLVWDGTERLCTMLETYFGARGHGEYLAAVGLRFMVSGVARIQKPGCQADHMLVLEGAQGIGKTSAVRALSVEPEWFAGNLPDIHSKDAPLQLVGRWFVEIAELKAVRNSQVEATKSFITETSDTFRPPYARRTAQFPRQTVFIGTTNESEYLRDRTGNRRYWPVKCTHINIPALLRDRDQLWAEAVREFRVGTRWHLTDQEMRLATDEQRARVFTTETEADVAEYLGKIAAAGQQEISVRDVLIYGLGLNPDTAGYAEAARKLGSAVAEAMEFAGWKKDARRGSDRRTMYKRVDKGDKV
jgi:putative DNA primase/helicase